MSIPSTPSTLAVPTMRHKGYYIHEADLTIRVHRIYIASSTYIDHRIPCLGGELYV
jgi:hypothetical protein